MTKHMGRISPSIKDQDKQSYQMFHSRLETDKQTNWSENVQFIHAKYIHFKDISVNSVISPLCNVSCSIKCRWETDRTVSTCWKIHRHWYTTQHPGETKSKQDGWENFIAYYRIHCSGSAVLLREFHWGSTCGEVKIFKLCCGFPYWQGVTVEQMRQSIAMVRQVCQPKFKVSDGMLECRQKHHWCLKHLFQFDCFRPQLWLMELVCSNSQKKNHWRYVLLLTTNAHKPNLSSDR